MSYAELANSSSEAKLILVGAELSSYAPSQAFLLGLTEHGMNRLFRSLTVGALVGCIGVTPLHSAQNDTAGVVLDARWAHVGGAELTNGTSLYSGDVVTTDSEGHAELRVRQTRFELIGESEGAFFPGANGAVAELRHGTLVVALNNPSESFEIFASDVRIVPKSERPVLAQITMNATCDVQIKVMHGNLEATTGKETRTLQEDHAYDVMPEFSVDDSRNPAISPDATTYHRGHVHGSCALAAKSGRPARIAGSSHFIELVGAGAAAVLIPVLWESLESPDRP